MKRQKHESRETGQPNRESTEPTRPGLSAETLPGRREEEVGRAHSMFANVSGKRSRNQQRARRGTNLRDKDAQEQGSEKSSRRRHNRQHKPESLADSVRRANSMFANAVPPDTPALSTETGEEDDDDESDVARRDPWGRQATALEVGHHLSAKALLPVESFEDPSPLASGHDPEDTWVDPQEWGPHDEQNEGDDNEYQDEDKEATTRIESRQKRKSKMRATLSRTRVEDRRAIAASYGEPQQRCACGCGNPVYAATNWHKCTVCHELVFGAFCLMGINEQTGKGVCKKCYGFQDRPRSSASPPDLSLDRAQPAAPIIAASAASSSRSYKRPIMRERAPPVKTPAPNVADDWEDLDDDIQVIDPVGRTPKTRRQTPSSSTTVAKNSVAKSITSASQPRHDASSDSEDEAQSISSTPAPGTNSNMRRSSQTPRDSSRTEATSGAEVMTRSRSVASGGLDHRLHGTLPIQDSQQCLKNLHRVLSSVADVNTLFLTYVMCPGDVVGPADLRAFMVAYTVFMNGPAPTEGALARWCVEKREERQSKRGSSTTSGRDARSAWPMVLRAMGIHKQSADLAHGSGFSTGSPPTTLLNHLARLMAQMEDTAPTTTNILASFNSTVAKTASMEGWSADMVDPLPPGICTLLHIQQDQSYRHMTYEASRRLVNPLATLSDEGVFWKQAVLHRREMVDQLQRATPAPIYEQCSPQVAKRAVIVYDPQTSHPYDNDRRLGHMPGPAGF